MYDIQFIATDDADWSVAIALIDANSNGVLAQAADASFEFEVSDRHSSRLKASTAAGTITQPQDGTIQWTFTKDQMASLSIDTTYSVGCRMTTNEGAEQLFGGTMALIDGGFR